MVTLKALCGSQWQILFHVHNAHIPLLSFPMKAIVHVEMLANKLITTCYPPQRQLHGVPSEETAAS